MHPISSVIACMTSSVYIVGSFQTIYTVRVILTFCGVKLHMNNFAPHKKISYSMVYMQIHAVEPPNKGHIGDNINSAVVSFVERLSSSRRFKMH